MQVIAESESIITTDTTGFDANSRDPELALWQETSNPRRRDRRILRQQGFELPLRRWRNPNRRVNQRKVPRLPRSERESQGGSPWKPSVVTR